MGCGPFPKIDDHLVVPEVTRDEIIGGRRVVSAPALLPQATWHSRLVYVLAALAAPGYSAAVDLLTRHDIDSDFASDACVFKKGIDPETGSRHLEEIAFEIVSEQNERDVTEKAVRMHRRGVRRIFGLFLKTQRICEWEPGSQRWRALATDARIEDPCLVAPLSVASLLDAASADDAVVQALAAKGNPELQKREAAARAEGRTEGIAAAILKILAARGLAVSPAQRQEILDCHDLDRLNRWLDRALLASSADQITSEP